MNMILGLLIGVGLGGILAFVPGLNLGLLMPLVPLFPADMVIGLVVGTEASESILSYIIGVFNPAMIVEDPWAFSPLQGVVKKGQGLLASYSAGYGFLMGRLLGLAMGVGSVTFAIVSQQQRSGSIGAMNLMWPCLFAAMIWILTLRLAPHKNRAILALACAMGVGILSVKIGAGIYPIIVGLFVLSAPTRVGAIPPQDEIEEDAELARGVGGAGFLSGAFSSTFFGIPTGIVLPIIQGVDDRAYIPPDGEEAIAQSAFANGFANGLGLYYALCMGSQRSMSAGYLALFDPVGPVKALGLMLTSGIITYGLCEQSPKIAKAYLMFTRVIPQSLVIHLGMIVSVLGCILISPGWQSVLIIILSWGVSHLVRWAGAQHLGLSTLAGIPIINYVITATT